MVMDMKRNNRGFTLVEIVIAVAIPAILIGIAAPVLLGNVNKTKMTTDKANAATIGQTAMLVVAEADGSGKFEDVFGTDVVIDDISDLSGDNTGFGKLFAGKLDTSTMKPKASGYSAFSLYITSSDSDQAEALVYAKPSGGGKLIQLWPEVEDTKNYGR